MGLESGMGSPAPPACSLTPRHGTTVPMQTSTSSPVGSTWQMSSQVHMKHIAKCEITIQEASPSPHPLTNIMLNCCSIKPKGYPKPEIIFSHPWFICSWLFFIETYPHPTADLSRECIIKRNEHVPRDLQWGAGEGEREGRA